jgi:hypothetical protein
MWTRGCCLRSRATEPLRRLAVSAAHGPARRSGGQWVPAHVWSGAIGCPQARIASSRHRSGISFRSRPGGAFAAVVSGWLGLLSPRLRLSRTPRSISRPPRLSSLRSATIEAEMPTANINAMSAKLPTGPIGTKSSRSNLTPHDPEHRRDRLIEVAEASDQTLDEHE